MTPVQRLSRMRISFEAGRVGGRLPAIRPKRKRATSERPEQVRDRQPA